MFCFVFSLCSVRVSFLLLCTPAHVGSAGVHPGDACVLRLPGQRQAIAVLWRGRADGAYHGHRGGKVRNGESLGQVRALSESSASAPSAELCWAFWGPRNGERNSDKFGLMSAVHCQQAAAAALPVAPCCAPCRTAPCIAVWTHTLPRKPPMYLAAARGRFCKRH